MSSWSDIHIISIHKIRGAKNQAHTMGANVKLAETMGQTTKVMGQMNKLVDPQKVAKTMHDFEMANAKMEMTEETSKFSSTSLFHPSHLSILVEHVRRQLVS